MVFGKVYSVSRSEMNYFLFKRLEKKIWIHQRSKVFYIRRFDTRNLFALSESLQNAFALLPHRMFSKRGQKTPLTFKRNHTDKSLVFMK